MPSTPPTSPGPPPPDFSRLEPLIEPWPAGRPFVRVFGHPYAPNAFNPGRGHPDPRGRFHFFADRAARVVPVLYGGEQEEVTIAETVLHDVPVKGPGRVVLKSRLHRLSLSTLRPRRELRLVQLLGFGLQRLEIRDQHLTDTEASEYPRTTAWTQALHAALPDIDGLLWMSRQFNASRALVLFGDRVAATSLQVVDSPRPLRMGPVRALVDRAANAAGIAVL